MAPYCSPVLISEGVPASDFKVGDMIDAAGKGEEANTKMLDDLITLAEHSARIGKPKVVADVLAGVLARDAKLADGDVKSAFVMALRRLSKPALLRAVAGMIIKYPEAKQAVYDILKRTGEDGAEACIQVLAPFSVNIPLGALSPEAQILLNGEPVGTS